MKLNRNEIGISDLLQHRACPRRFEFGMRRHTGNAAPESWSDANAYGSAIHTAISVYEKTQSEEQAIRAAVQEFENWLGPDDIESLRVDIDTYIERDDIGVRTVVNEEDLRFPLFIYKGEQIFFRFKLDRLYVREDNDSVFIHRDYKSSKWARSEEEVHEDLQLWAYNVGIHEVYPECESLEQVYDQLRFGEQRTHKTAEQRERMKEWMIEVAIAVLEDETLEPRFNEFCPWCPIKMDCKVVREDLTDFAQAKIAVIAPRNPKLKQNGEPGKTLLPPELDDTRFGEYVELLPDVSTARKTLEAFEVEVKAALKAMPTERRTELGHRLREKAGRRSVPPTAQQALLDELGPEFFHLTTISLTGVERFYGSKKDPRYQRIESMAEKGAPIEEIIPLRRS